jgi:pimeloyl-ACP methyl ester carboxylesterase
MRIKTHRLPGLVLRDHEFQVPLDHARPAGDQIAVFAREVVAPGKEEGDLPWLLYLQGGPGFGAPRPDESSGWLKRALEEFRVLLLDPRGAGRSTPVTYQTMARLETAQAQADYLKHFRADAIVQDAEHVRRKLVGGAGPWSVLGQSYGGFCLVHYLSAAPEGLKEALFTGGLPPIRGSADDVYRATYRQVAEKNRRYYERYPGDVARAADIADVLAGQPVPLPGGGQLTVRRFQQLGMALGSSTGFEFVHYLLEEAFVAGPHGLELGYGFLREVENAHSFETNPIYAVLHEAIYCQSQASNWSAERVRAEYPQFSPAARDPLLFTGEMIYPWMFDDYAYLRPLKDAAELLAAEQDWPALYDPATLRANAVPCAAAMYYDDMYVERAFSEETARAIGNMRVWVTNEYEHNGLRAGGEKLFGRLLDMARGKV